jgi:redox-sensitive bicupin YhaK (pirin superfamily)
MTSGSGIMHEEMPRLSEQGNVYGFQLWVNLPSNKKMSAPRYQEVSEDTIPTVEQNGTNIRVVAGSYASTQGPVKEIAANPIYLDVELEPSAEFSLSIPEDHTTVSYVFEGKGIFGLDANSRGELVSAVKLIEFSNGSQLRVKAAADSEVRFMLIAGAPFNEPIVPYGPFVMNTPEEIQQALEDLRNGTFVKIGA